MNLRITPPTNLGTQNLQNKQSIKKDQNVTFGMSMSYRVRKFANSPAVKKAFMDSGAEDYENLILMQKTKNWHINTKKALNDYVGFIPKHETSKDDVFINPITLKAIRRTPENGAYVVPANPMSRESAYWSGYFRTKEDGYLTPESLISVGRKVRAYENALNGNVTQYKAKLAKFKEQKKEIENLIKLAKKENKKINPKSAEKQYLKGEMSKEDYQSILNEVKDVKHLEQNLRNLKRPKMKKVNLDELSSHFRL